VPERPVAVPSEPAPERAPVAVGEIDPPSGSRPRAESGRGRGRIDAAQTGRSSARPARTRTRREEPVPSLLDRGETGVSLTRDEVVAATGLTAKELGELERFGLVESRSLGNTSYYDEDALVVAKLAAGFLGHGVEARHLRMYKVAAEREAGVFEQLVMPLLKQRNPASRSQATERLDELATLGARLRAAMLRQALSDHLGRP
jgi:hypothetical protein